MTSRSEKMLALVENKFKIPGRRKFLKLLLERQSRKEQGERKKLFSKTKDTIGMIYLFVCQFYNNYSDN